MRESITAKTPLSELERISHRSEQIPLQSDAELLELYLSGGDREAMEALISRYAPLVASVCALTVADRACAEDAFQATFLILLAQAKKIRKRASLAAWLHGVAYRCACRLRKQRRDQPLTEHNEAGMASSKIDTDPLTALARQMNLEALDRELEKLPDQLREPLVEHYLMGLSAPEIAERMELSVSAVEGRLRRGRHALRTRLARRGISLSVLVAGSELFQEQLAASDGGAWATQFVDQYFPAGSETSPTGNHPSLTSSQISSLVTGETTMFSTASLKSALVVGLLLASGTIVAFTVEAGDPQREAAASRALTVPAYAIEPAVMAQLSAPPSSSFGSSEGSSSQSSSVGQGGGSSLMSEGGGMGMSGGGAGDMGGMGGMGGMAGAGMPAPPAVEWSRPETSEGEEPAWLGGGRSAIEAIEKNRLVLSTKLDFKFDAWPLSEVVRWLSQETGTQFELDTQAIEEEGIAASDTPVTAEGFDTSVREIIRRATRGLELSYVVTESSIELTTMSAANDRPNMRFYDLSYVLPNSANARSVMRAVEEMGDAGFTEINSMSLVGSMMIVNAPDVAHQQIEILLLNLAKMNPRNAEHDPLDPPAVGGLSGGMGGMGGGFGGGMGGMF